MATATGTKSDKVKKGKGKGIVRKVKYPEYKVELRYGKNALTRKEVREYLGWCTSPEEAEKAGVKHPTLKDEEGTDVFLLNNTGNRPLQEAWARTLGQDVLNSGPKLPVERRRWQFNGESVIIGDYGNVLSAQHRMIGLELACQQWEGENSSHWKKIWPTMPTLDTIIVYGVKETPEVVRTLDNVRPRSLADVIYTSGFFANMDPADHKKCAKILDHAVKLLWHRTGAMIDPFAPRRTHGESIDFINRHMSLLKTVKHIFKEDKKRAISKYISPGYAAAMCFLMAASNTDGEEYRGMSTPTEKGINFDNREKAYGYWSTFANGEDTELYRVREAIGALTGPDASGTPSLAEKMAILMKGWFSFLAGEDVTTESVELDYYQDSDNIYHLREKIDVGGIDMGEPEKPDDDDEEEDEEDNSEEAIESRKIALREEHKKKLMEGRKKKSKKDEDEDEEEEESVATKVVDDDEDEEEDEDDSEEDVEEDEDDEEEEDDDDDDDSDDE